MAARGALAALMREIEENLRVMRIGPGYQGDDRNLEANLRESRQILTSMDAQLEAIVARSFGPSPAPPAVPPAQVMPPAHWAPDPTGRHEVRFWDGAYWTTHVADGGRVMVEDLR